MLFHISREWIDSSEDGQKRVLQLFSKWEQGPGEFQAFYGWADRPGGVSIVEAEKAAILETIATETEAYFNEDYELWKDQFVDEPYFMRIGYWEGRSAWILKRVNILERQKRSKFLKSWRVNGTWHISGFTICLNSG